MPAETSAGVIFLKLINLKCLCLLAALLGAGIMTIFRPPKNKTELFCQGIVALGASILFGGSLIKFLDHYLVWLDLQHASPEEVLQINATVHGLLGAVSWGIFGGLASVRDKMSKNPISLLKGKRHA